MRAIDLLHLGREKVICCWKVDGVLIDPGPSPARRRCSRRSATSARARCCSPTSTSTTPARPGRCVRRWPDLPVYVHERGAPHLVDPERLVASADAALRRGGHGAAVGRGRPRPRGEPARAHGRRARGRGRVPRRVHARPRLPSRLATCTRTGLRLRRRRRRRADPAVGAASSRRRRRRTSTSPRGSARSTSSPAGSPRGSRSPTSARPSDPAAQLERCRDALHAEAALAGEQDLDGFMAAIRERIAAEVPRADRRPTSRPPRWTTSTSGWTAGIPSRRPR